MAKSTKPAAKTPAKKPVAKPAAKKESPKLAKVKANIANAKAKVAPKAASLPHDPVAIDRFVESAIQMNRLISILTTDCASAYSGHISREHFCDLVHAIGKAMVKTKEKQGYKFD